MKTITPLGSKTYIPESPELFIMNKYEEISFTKEGENVYTIKMEGNSAGRQVFSLKMLEELSQSLRDAMFDKKYVEGNKIFVLKGTPEVFNYGGDLELFLGLLESKCLDGLKSYGKMCIDSLITTHNSVEYGMTTIALVEGTALGGGFEMALGCNILIAEDAATFGLPESNFGFFPGMGAFEFLHKRVGLEKTKEIVYSGKVFTAQEMFDLGVIDYLVPVGKGSDKISEIIKSERENQFKFNNLRKIENSLHHISHDQMIKSVNLWAETVINIPVKKKKFIQRLISRQYSKK